MNRFAVIRAALVLGVACSLLVLSSAAHAQIWPWPLPSQKKAQPTGGPQVIHVHHHYHYPVQGPYAPMINTQTDPDMYDADVVAGDPEPSFVPKPWDHNWGDMGFHAYLGKQGSHTGLIVSNVTPNSPAAKLGLTKGDIIMSVNDQRMDQLSYLDIDKLFLDMTSLKKTLATFVVWNMDTLRTSTLQAELENDDPESEVENPAER